LILRKNLDIREISPKIPGKEGILSLACSRKPGKRMEFWLTPQKCCWIKFKLSLEGPHFIFLLENKQGITWKITFRGRSEVWVWPAIDSTLNEISNTCLLSGSRLGLLGWPMAMVDLSRP